MPRRLPDDEREARENAVFRAAVEKRVVRDHARERWGREDVPLVDELADAVVARLAALTEARPARLALSYDEAAVALGVSTKHFHRHVAPRLRVTMSGGRRLVPVRELERYLSENAV